MISRGRLLNLSSAEERYRASRGLRSEASELAGVIDKETGDFIAEIQRPGLQSQSIRVPFAEAREKYPEQYARYEELVGKKETGTLQYQEDRPFRFNRGVSSTIPGLINPAQQQRYEQRQESQRRETLRAKQESVTVGEAPESANAFLLGTQQGGLSETELKQQGFLPSGSRKPTAGDVLRSYRAQRISEEGTKASFFPFQAKELVEAQRGQRPASSIFQTPDFSTAIKTPITVYEKQTTTRGETNGDRINGVSVGRTNRTYSAPIINLLGKAVSVSEKIKPYETAYQEYVEGGLKLLTSPLMGAGKLASAGAVSQAQFFYKPYQYGLSKLGVSLPKSKAVSVDYTDPDIQSALVVGALTIAPPLISYGAGVGFVGLQTYETIKRPTPASFGALTVGSVGVIVGAPLLARRLSFVGKEFVKPETIFDVGTKELGGVKDFPLSKSVPEIITKFEKTRELSPTKEIIAVHTASQPVKGEVIGTSPRITTKAGKLAEDPGLYVTPYGGGSPYFLGVLKQKEYSIKLIPDFRTPRPTATIITNIEGVRRLPSSALEQPGYEASAQASQAFVGSRTAVIPKRSELAFSGALPIGKGVRAGTSETQAVLPPGTILEAVTPTSFFKRITGFSRYTKVQGEFIPLKEYKIQTGVPKKVSGQQALSEIQRSDVATQQYYTTGSGGRRTIYATDILSKSFSLRQKKSEQDYSKETSKKQQSYSERIMSLAKSVKAISTKPSDTKTFYQKGTPTQSFRKQLSSGITKSFSNQNYLRYLRPELSKPGRQITASYRMPKPPPPDEPDIPLDFPERGKGKVEDKSRRFKLREPKLRYLPSLGGALGFVKGIKKAPSSVTGFGQRGLVLKTKQGKRTTKRFF